ILRFPRGATARWILDEDADLWRDLDDVGSSGRAARAEIARRFAAVHRPFTTDAPAPRYRLQVGQVASLPEGPARAGIVTRGRFVRGVPSDTWCDRRNLAEVHRRTLALLRDRAAPVKVAQLAAFLIDRHRAADVAGAVRLLSGAPAPQETFERDLL